MAFDGQWLDRVTIVAHLPHGGPQGRRQRRVRDHRIEKDVVYRLIIRP